MALKTGFTMGWGGGMLTCGWKLVTFLLNESPYFASKFISLMGTAAKADIAGCWFFLLGSSSSDVTATYPGYRG